VRYSAIVRRLACKPHNADRGHSPAGCECKPLIPGTISGDQDRRHRQCSANQDEGPSEKSHEEKTHGEKKFPHALQVTPSIAGHK